MMNDKHNETNHIKNISNNDSPSKILEVNSNISELQICRIWSHNIFINYNSFYYQNEMTKNNNNSSILNMLSKILEITIQNVYLHPVTFKLIFRPLNKSLFHIDEYTEYEQKLINNLSWDTLILDEKLTMATGKICTNENTNVMDRICNIKLPTKDFMYTIENVNGITIRDITEIVYRLKRSKYDWWYELYYGITIKKITNISSHNNLSIMKFIVEFDYGS